MSIQLKILILITVSAVLAALTWRSLVSIHKHGIFRLFGWITLVALILLNIDYWFVDPFSIRQIVSWLLFVICMAIATYGTISLRGGKSNGMRMDPSLIGIERTTQLVMTGAYRYIRHPMYSSFLFGAWGVFFKHYSPTSAFLALLTTIFAVVTAKNEEYENISYFGDAYRDYMKRTKMFIPFIF